MQNLKYSYSSPLIALLSNDFYVCGVHSQRFAIEKDITVF
jgi:hypothetical protein